MVLSGVKVADLRAIMQFIYTGEVSVTEECLPDLLEVAELLGVRGLKTGSDNKEDKPNEEVEVNKEESSQEAETKTEEEEIVPSISITKVTPTKTEEKKETPIKTEKDSFQISVKKDLTSELIIADNSAIADNCDNIEDDNIAADDNIAVDDDVTNDSDKTETSFTTPFTQSMISPNNSQYSSLFPPSTSPNPYMRPLSMAPSPLVSMSNLAAMYQHNVSPSKQVKEKVAVRTEDQKSLEWYRQCSQEGKVSLDLLPEDINSIMSQSTTPFCPICNKDCANFPNLRSHLQVMA